MKKVAAIVFVFIILRTEHSVAQEQFSVSQYYQTQAILNPGFTGVDDFFDVKLGYSNKWIGLENSPSTTFLSGFGSIGDKTSYNQSPLRTSNPNQIEFIEAQKARIRSHGIGGYITKQQQGAFDQIRLMINYAYHIPINSKIKIALGTSLGISNINIDLNKIEVWDKANDPVYQSYVNGDGNYWRFLMGAGGVMYGKKSYVGISYMPLVDIPFSSSDRNLVSEEKVIAMAGTKIDLNSFMRLQPGIFFESSSAGKSKFVGSILLDINNLVKPGITLSNLKDISFNVAFNYKNEFGISYDFQTNLGGETTIGNGTHEVILSLNLFNHLNAMHRLW
ncbi:MAG: PorP/SprF family type IX secretion system membrane protein [Cyclobacteriaceae bacterium]|nr:PorP/SprF family type IX secretion system membrane protein [Cyclobacteriaceae bacterium]